MIKFACKLLTLLSAYALLMGGLGSIALLVDINSEPNKGFVIIQGAAGWVVLTALAWLRIDACDCGEGWRQ